MKRFTGMSPAAGGTLAIVWIAFAFVLPIPAQDTPAPRPIFKCVKCKGEAWVPCAGKEHDQKKICGVTLAHQCEGLLRAPCCRGFMKLPCPGCKDAEAAEEYAAETKKRQTWLDVAAKEDVDTGVPMTHLEGDRFILHSSIAKWRVKDETLTRVRAAHRFLVWLEETATKFQAITGVLPKEKQVFWMCNSEQENMRITLLKMAGGRPRTYRLYAEQSRVCQWPDPAEVWNTDDEWHMHTVHNAAHTLIQSSIQYHRELPSWADEGIAAWLEIDAMKVSHTFCYHEVQVRDSWANVDWAKRILGDVQSGNEANLASIIPLPLDKMKHRDIAHSWSFIDYLVRARPEEFKEFFAVFKKTKDTKAALDQSVKLSTVAFQEAWRAWVKKAYQPK